ncbi:MAG TPA: Ada metal-binding domain-containing protein [Pyrinomonadaceae bacterium]|nr:Ada metal-binding domain-containing protein [Pyrinomonadaceae bacterium]
MSFKEEFIQDWKWYVGFAALAAFFAYALYNQKTREWHIDAVMNGPIRASKKSRIYHVPTCPNYDSIHADNLRLFPTIEEANSAGFRPAQNCGSDFYIREVNETQEPDPPDLTIDQQYR